MYKKIELPFHRFSQLFQNNTLLYFFTEMFIIKTPESKE